MRIVTWNTHSLVGKEMEEVRRELGGVGAYLGTLSPDVVALQEVNQPRGGRILPSHHEGRWYSCERSISLREGNYLVELLERMPSSYRGIWLPMKVGYGQFDEGLGFLFRGEMAELRWLPISASRSYESWRTRYAMLLKRKGETDWFCNLHLGWWEDGEETFRGQWERLKEAFPRSERLWLMGDFNSSPDVRGQGYDTIASGGFYDCFSLAKRTVGQETVAVKDLDGWQERERDGVLRIDQIWCRYPAKIGRCQVCMDGKEGPLASDHYGVWIETDER